MNIQTLTAPSIHEALQEARRMFGDEVVLLESHPPSADQPARITIMTDQPLATPPKPPTAPPPAPPRKAAPKAPAEPKAAPVGQPFGYAATQKKSGASAPAQPSAASAQDDAEFSGPPKEARTFSPTPATMLDQDLTPDEPKSQVPMVEVRPMQRGQLFPVEHRPHQPPVPAPDWKPIDRLLENHLEKLHDRLGQIEHKLGDGMLGAGLTWGGHPLYTALLKQKMEPAFLARLFNTLTDQGLSPNTDKEALKPALAESLYHMLHRKRDRLRLETIAFIGPSGSGKTSLVLKLAKHAGFFGRRRTAVLIVLPENREEIGYSNPLSLYIHYKVPALAVRNQRDVQAAMKKLQSFNHILIDTPPLPVRPEGAHRVLRHVQDVLAPLGSFETQFIINTTRVAEHYSKEYLENLPMPPGALALTHLDETLSWGRVAQWMCSVDLPVYFASTGPEVPDSLEAYTTNWFVELIMSL